MCWILKGKEVKHWTIRTAKTVSFLIRKIQQLPISTKVLSTKKKRIPSVKNSQMKTPSIQILNHCSPQKSRFQRIQRTTYRWLQRTLQPKKKLFIQLQHLTRSPLTNHPIVKMSTISNILDIPFLEHCTLMIPNLSNTQIGSQNAKTLYHLCTTIMKQNCLLFPNFVKNHPSNEPLIRNTLFPCICSKYKSSKTFHSW
jgi:hypothetical protein